MKEQEIPEATVDRWGWGSIALNVMLSLLNLGIAVASGSLAVVAEMIHNLVDLLASIAVLLGLKISQRHSQSFPYGLYKVENIVSVGMSLLIFFTGFEIVREALFAPLRKTNASPWMLVGALISAVLPFLFSFFELRAGKVANSPSVIASAQEYRTHVFSSGVVLISLIGQMYGLHLDRMVSLFVVFFIARTGWELLKDGMRVLLDASLEKETLSRVREIVEADPATVQVKSLTGRNSGRYRFLEMEVAFRVDDFNRAYAISQRIEQAIRTGVPHVERILIHYKPVERTWVRIAFPLADPGGKLSEHFGEAPYFAVVTTLISNGLVEKQEVIQNPSHDLPKAKGIRVAEWLVSQKVDRVILTESLQGKGPEYVFGDAGVDIVYTEARTMSAAVDKLTDQPNLKK